MIRLGRTIAIIVIATVVLAFCAIGWVMAIAAIARFVWS